MKQTREEAAQEEIPNAQTLDGPYRRMKFRPGQAPEYASSTDETEGQTEPPPTSQKEQQTKYLSDSPSPVEYLSDSTELTQSQGEEPKDEAGTEWTLSEENIEPQIEDTDGEQQEEVIVRVHWQGEEHQLRLRASAGKARSEHQIMGVLGTGPDPVAFRYSKFHMSTWRQDEHVWVDKTVTIRVKHTNTAAVTTIQVPMQASEAEVHKQARKAMSSTEMQPTRIRRQNPEGTEWQSHEGVELEDVIPEVPFTIEWEGRRKKGSMPRDTGREAFEAKAPGEFEIPIEKTIETEAWRTEEEDDPPRKVDPFPIKTAHYRLTERKRQEFLDSDTPSEGA
jgi:hypothetical protein